MSRNAAPVLLASLVLTALGLFVPVSAFAQLTPPAGSAGAGNSAISGIPSGPANPSVLSDPSGIGNASRMPALTPNTPAPVTTYGSVNAPSSAQPRVVVPPYTGASQRRYNAQSVKEGKRPARKGRAQTSTYMGICRGC